MGGTGEETDELVGTIAEALVRRGQALALVECSLGGLLGATLTAMPGASRWFLASIAPYAASAREAVLGVTSESLGQDGAVSESAAQAYAIAAHRVFGADWTLAETGLLGPRGTHRSAKPPGLGYFCLLTPGGEWRKRVVRTGLDDREANRRAFRDAALTLIRDGVESRL